MKRRRFSETEVLKTVQLMLWGRNIDNNILCYRCHSPLFYPLFNNPPGSLGRTIVSDIATGDFIEREHYHELALGGDNEPINCHYSHKKCHKEVTNGTKATTLGSSKHSIAKTKRIAAGGKKKRGPRMPSRPFSKTSRPFQKKRKINAS